MSELVTYQREDSIATITINDGKKNALSPAVLAGLHSAFERAQADGVVVVLTGREGVFSGGFDLKILGNGGPDAYHMLLAGFRLAERVLSFPTPVLIACPGHALAMGSFLLLSADYRLGTRGDFKIGANEVAIGITMPFFGVEICRQRLAPAHFNRAVINAEIYSPDDAVAAGFLDRVVDAKDFASATKEMATNLAKLNMDAHAATKLRARDQALKALHAAIAADDAILRAMAESQ
jgi:enoyl-CoA hydratase